MSLACGFFEGTRPWRCLAERLALEGGNRFANSIPRFVALLSSIVSQNHPILLANSEAPKFRLTYYPSEGTEAWSNPCGNLGFVGGDIGSPTVSHRFTRHILPPGSDFCHAATWHARRGAYGRSPGARTETPLGMTGRWRDATREPAGASSLDAMLLRRAYRAIARGPRRDGAPRPPLECQGEVFNLTAGRPRRLAVTPAVETPPPECTSPLAPPCGCKRQR